MDRITVTRADLETALAVWLATLSMQLEDRHQLSKSNHRRLLVQEDMALMAARFFGRECQSRNYQNHFEEN